MRKIPYNKMESVGNDTLLWYTTLMNVVTSRYTWEGTPVKSEIIEKQLVEHGQVFGYMDISEFSEVMILPCNSSSDLDVYAQPLSVSVYGHGYNKVYPISSGVLLYENMCKLPLIHHVVKYAEILTNIDDTMRMNLIQQRTPYIIATNENSLLTQKNIVNKIHNNELAIYVDKNLSNGVPIVEVMDIQAPYLLDKMHEHKHEMKNEFLTLIGINNSPVRKKERMITDEMNANNEHIQITLMEGLRLRQEFAEKVNELCGTNITVKINDVLMNETEKEGENENVV